MKSPRPARVLPTFVILTVLFAAPALALDNQQASMGIKEALTNATTGAVNLVGRPGGYFDDPAIKILLPSQMQPVAKGLRAVGAGAQVDKFEKSMNDAAEAAAPKAEPIFENAIRNMSISDAQGIVTGGKTSATDYFRRKTSGELTAAFTPIVKQAMAKYSVTQQYQSMMGKYQSKSPGSGLLGGNNNLGLFNSGNSNVGAGNSGNGGNVGLFNSGSGNVGLGNSGNGNLGVGNHKVGNHNVGNGGTGGAGGSGGLLFGNGGAGALGGTPGKFDVDSYVVHKSLDGLFYMVGQEEAKIRTNPAAQVTPLLREVFGGK